MRGRRGLRRPGRGRGRAAVAQGAQSHIVFAVDKLDAAARLEEVFARVRGALARFSAEAGIEPARIVAISALRGETVSTPSAVDGYTGPPCSRSSKACPTPKTSPKAARSCRCSS